VSGNNTFVVGPDLPYGGQAVPTQVNSIWKACIPGAQWIWDYPVPHAVTPAETAYFKEEFCLKGHPICAKLYIAADNFVDAYVNGHKVYCDTTGLTYQEAVIVDVTNYITCGDNVIAFVVTNKGFDDFICQSNPAGLLYRLDISYELS
jgi:hypothetical protein